MDTQLAIKARQNMKQLKGRSLQELAVHLRVSLPTVYKWRSGSEGDKLNDCAAKVNAWCARREK